MQKIRPSSLTLLLVLGAAAGCSKKAHPTTPAASTGGPGAGICGELDSLIAAARDNFPDLRRQDQPVEVDHQAGFQATVVVAGTAGCHILTSEPPYPDAYECDLASSSTPAAAKELIDRWGTAVAACPQLASWHPSTGADGGRSWELETEDNHELVVRFSIEGDDHARPVLVVRNDEI